MSLDTIARVAGDVADPAPEVLGAARGRFDAAVGAAELRVSAVRRGRRRRRVAGILTAAAATTGVAVIAPLLTAAPASAEAVLLAAAESAGHQVDETAGAPYWYVRSEVDYPEIEPATREIWKGRTGESVLRDEADARSAAAVVGEDPSSVEVRTEGFGAPATFSVGDQVLRWEDLDALPVDAGALGEALRDMVAGHPAGEDNVLWEGVTDLLRESPASPSLRRALWQVAANVPGVELVGEDTDAFGRAGTAIERNMLAEGWYREVFVLDPGDGRMLEWRMLNADGGVVYRWTLIEQGPSDAAPVPQPPICGPGSESGKSC